MIKICQNNGSLVLEVQGHLEPRHENQLAFWQFNYSEAKDCLVYQGTYSPLLIKKLVEYFEKKKLDYDLADDIRQILQSNEKEAQELNAARSRGSSLKDGVIDPIEAKEFFSFLKTNISRPLKDHQLKAALHLLSTVNGANFSVPGSGKTAVVLAVFQRLKQLGEVDSLFVVGPPACFGPWQVEFEAVLGRKPIAEILAGGNIDDRRSKYFVNQKTAADLYLTTFQTLQRDWEQVKMLFEQQGVKFYLVVDEAHYIKQIDGAWANAVLNIAEHASRRCILTGSPFPHSYLDAFNLFDVLWPKSSPIPSNQRHEIELHTQRHEIERAAKVLDESIWPLFYRVRKDDLGLAPQIFNKPLHLEMNKYERLIYDSILDRIRDLSQKDYFRNIDLLMRLRRGRIIRLRQCLSYAALLGSAIPEHKDYKENLVGENLSLSDVIKNYDNLETPRKLEELLLLTNELLSKGEKVVIWSNFVKTLKLIQKRVSEAGHGVRLIYGGTPIQMMNIKEELNRELTREEIIAEFVSPTSGINVLVANPAACAESISLHKTCSHAVYYDMSYNCAQYIQSLDRIHRVGGSENKPAYYYFLQYEDTIDDDILMNVRRKAENMSAILDQDYSIYSLDMFAEDEELEAYERLFG